MSNPQPPATPRQRLDRLLDGGFNTEAQRVNQAYSRALSRGVLAQRLTEITQEAARLQAAGLPFTRDNPILRALYADLETVLGREMAGVLSASAGNLEEQAILAARGLTRDLALGGIDNATLARLGFTFNLPNPDTLVSAVNLTGSQAYNDFIDSFGTTETDKIRQIILSNIIAGKNPLTTARLLSKTIDGLPRADMATFMRTLQLTSYRKAQDAIALANRDILEKKIRIASLDSRCCLACVALHGTELKIDESVIDHHNGRCTAILAVKGRPMNIRTGEDWFNAQSEDTRRAIAGEANFNALQAGKVKLGDFVGSYTDPLFGKMLQEQSLKGILGNDAKRYYAGYKAPAITKQSIVDTIENDRNLVRYFQDVDAETMLRIMDDRFNGRIGLSNNGRIQASKWGIMSGVDSYTRRVNAIGKVLEDAGLIEVTPSISGSVFLTLTQQGRDFFGLQ